MDWDLVHPAKSEERPKHLPLERVLTGKLTGCAELCPENSLKTGKGTRYILAGTDELHKQIEDLRARTRQLEEALAVSHSAQSTKIHPLLRPDAINVANELQTQADADGSRLHQEFDVLMLSDTGRMQWLGTTALSEWFVRPEPNATEARRNPDPQTPLATSEIRADSLIFSADTLTSKQVSEYRQIVLSMVPEEGELLLLANLYYEQVAWFYNPVPRKRLQQIVAPLLSGQPDKVEPHELSSLFTILALGTMMDLSHPPDHPSVYRFSNIGKLCLSLDCIFGQTTVATIEANLLRLIFLLFARDRAAPMKVYAQLGLIGRLIISMGMHRDPARWDFDEEECERRRRLFWEWVSFDTWQVWGRPSSLLPRSYDCNIPWDRHGELEGEEPKFQRWKFIFIRDILLDVLAHSTACGVSATLGAVMKLDRRIRDYATLEMAVQSHADTTQPPQAVIYQRNVMFCILESTRAYLHRPFFISALNENLTDPLRSKFAASVLAVHAHCCAIVGRAKPILDFQPQAARFFVWWTQGFSAVVALGALVVRAPGSTLSASALTEINHAAEAFERAKSGFRPEKLLPSVLKIQSRAQLAVERFRAGQAAAPLADAMDVLPGIVGGSTLIKQALFPKASEHCALTGTFTIMNGDTPPDQSPEAMDGLVSSYLQNLQTELDEMERQRMLTQTSGATTDIHVQADPYAFSTMPQDQFFFPPAQDLLPAPPPLTTQSDSLPEFDSQMWAGFMAQFGGEYI